MGVQLNRTILFFQHYTLALFQYLKSLASCPKSSMHCFCVVQLVVALKYFSEIGLCARSRLHFYFFIFFDVTTAHVLCFVAFSLCWWRMMEAFWLPGSYNMSNLISVSLSEEIPKSKN